MAAAIVDHLHRHNPAVRIVWDPVIRASSGREFWTSVGEEWKAVAARCYLLTPNWNEIGQLYPGEDVLEGCRELTRDRGVIFYLKGGHHPVFPGRDYLFSGGTMQVLEPEADGRAGVCEAWIGMCAIVGAGGEPGAGLSFTGGSGAIQTIYTTIFEQ
jgi:hydroxymethylpyrimidine/phosphomethylpyrimidine kinase